MQAQAPSEDPNLEIALHVLETSPLIDGHNDLLWRIRTDEDSPGDVVGYGLNGRSAGHTDIPRLREGGVGAQFWSVYVPVSTIERGTAAATQRAQFDLAHRLVRAYSEDLELARTVLDVERIHAEGRIASILGMEGGHVIENSLESLREFYDLGARYLTLTHSANVDWADSATDAPVHGGLTPFGREVVREMNRLGMMVDLSHVSDPTMSDALDVTEAPVIFSHSSARALTDHARNVPDSILRRLPENRGIVMVAFYPPFVISGGTATLRDVANHLDHIRAVAGIDHVGLGSDFDGIPEVVQGLEDVSTFPMLLAELSQRGWSEAELRQVAGGNILRVMRETEATAERLRTERAPSRARIDELDLPGG